MPHNEPTRRQFLKATSAAVAASALGGTGTTADTKPPVESSRILMWIMTVVLCGCIAGAGCSGSPRRGTPEATAHELFRQLKAGNVDIAARLFDGDDVSGEMKQHLRGLAKDLASGKRGVEVLKSKVEGNYAMVITRVMKKGDRKPGFESIPLVRKNGQWRFPASFYLTFEGHMPAEIARLGEWSQQEIDRLSGKPAPHGRRTPAASAHAMDARMYVNLLTPETTVEELIRLLKAGNVKLAATLYAPDGVLSAGKVESSLRELSKALAFSQRVVEVLKSKIEGDYAIVMTRVIEKGISKSSLRSTLLIRREGQWRIISQQEAKGQKRVELERLQEWFRQEEKLMSEKPAQQER
jgi:hypothetical protein